MIVYFFPNIKKNSKNHPVCAIHFQAMFLQPDWIYSKQNYDTLKTGIVESTLALLLGRRMHYVYV